MQMRLHHEGKDRQAVHLRCTKWEVWFVALGDWVFLVCVQRNQIWVVGQSTNLPFP